MKLYSERVSDYLQYIPPDAERKLGDENIEKKAMSEIGTGDANPGANYREEAIWLYGIDNLQQQRTPKEQVYFALSHAIDNPSDMSSSLDGLLTSPGQEPDTPKREQVRIEDIVATYDALAIRVGVLDSLQRTNSDAQDMRAKKQQLETYLSSKNIDLSEDQRIKRLDKLEEASKKYYRGIEPGKLSDNFKRLARRASALEAYVGESAQSEIDGLMEKMDAYPQNEDDFAQAMVQEFLYGKYVVSTTESTASGPPKLEGKEVQVESPEQAAEEEPSKLLQLDLDQETVSKIYLDDTEAKQKVVNMLIDILTKAGLNADDLLFRGIHQPRSVQTATLLDRYGTDRFFGYGPGVFPMRVDNLLPYKNRGETQTLTADTYASPHLEHAFSYLFPLSKEALLTEENAFLLCYAKSELTASKYPNGKQSGELWRGYFNNDPKDALKIAIQIKI